MDRQLNIHMPRPLAHTWGYVGVGEEGGRGDGQAVARRVHVEVGGARVIDVSRHATQRRGIDIRPENALRSEARKMGVCDIHAFQDGSCAACHLQPYA